MTAEKSQAWRRLHEEQEENQASAIPPLKSLERAS